ncbi:MAG: hypothetical protein LBD54_02515 [Puniceicoccales bacterium]|jgi:hypothetical protein|nr:hypothetical protein [Puniceicoccales bacterium]
MGLVHAFFHVILWPFLKVLELLWWFLKKCLLAIFVIFLGLFLVGGIALVFLNTWLPFLLEWHIENKTGFSLHIDTSRCNLFKGHLEFENILMKNPATRYPIDHALSIELLEVDIRPSRLWKSFWSNDELLISNIYLDIDDLSIVRNAQGTINFVECFDALGREKGKKSPDLSESAKDQDSVQGQGNGFPYVSAAGSKGPNKKEEAKWRIEQLTLHLDILRWKDFKPAKAQEQEFRIFYRHQWIQITSLDTIIHTLLTDFKPYGISLFMQSIFDSFFDIPGISQVHSGVKALQSLGKRVLSEVKGKFETVSTQTTTKTH